MRAMMCLELGRALQLCDIKPPRAGPGQVLIDVAACGVNFADTLITEGKYQEKPAVPFIPGFEVAGTIAALGSDDVGFSPGDAVAGLVPRGGYGEKVVADAAGLWRVPDGMGPEVAAALPIAYGTSHIALLDRARLQPGEVLLVHGAAGGVGLTAVEIGKRLGATVIATAGSADKLAIAGSHGADHLINYTQENIRDRVKQICNGAGADVVYDPVGGEMFQASLRCVNPGARIVLIGFASGTVPQIPANILLVKNVSCIGFYYSGWIARHPQANAACFKDVLDWWQAGNITPRIDKILPFEHAKDAAEMIRNRHVKGKLVLSVGQGAGIGDQDHMSLIPDP